MNVLLHETCEKKRLRSIVVAKLWKLNKGNNNDTNQNNEQSLSTRLL